MSYTYTLRINEILTHEITIDADNYEDALVFAEDVIDRVSFSVDEASIPDCSYDWERTEGIDYNSIDLVETDDPEQEN